MVITCQILWGSNLKNSCILGCLKMQMCDFAIWLNVKDDNFQVIKRRLIWLDTPVHLIMCRKIFSWNYHKKSFLENSCIWHSVFTTTLKHVISTVQAFWPLKRGYFKVNAIFNFFFSQLQSTKKGESDIFLCWEVTDVTITCFFMKIENKSTHCSCLLESNPGGTLWKMKYELNWIENQPTQPCVAFMQS